MTQSIVIAHGRLIERATAITATSEAAGLPVTNLQDQRPRKVYRSAGVGSSIDIDIDLGATTQWDTLVLIWTNLSAAATWRIRTAATQGGLSGASGSDDSGTISVWTGAGRPSSSLYPLLCTDSEYEGLPCLYRAGTARNRRWIRITITDTGNTNGFIEIGRLIVDLGWQPVRTVSRKAPPAMGVQPTDVQAQAPSGAMNTGTRARPRFQTISLPHLTKDEALGGLYEIFRLRGKSKDVVVIRDPSETTHLHRLLTHGLLTTDAPKIEQWDRLRCRAEFTVTSFY